MMVTEKDRYTALVEILNDIEDRCKSLNNIIDQFETYTISYALLRLLKKLLMLMRWIMKIVESLSREHNGTGYILVFEGVKEGITLHWTEARELAIDKNRWLEHGLKLYSPGEIIEHIGNLMPLLFKGSWIEVVNWLNSYGKSPGLDWKELL